MSMKIKGLDKLEKKLNTLANNAKSISGTHEYDFSEVFTPEFMSKHTNFSTISEFLEASPEKITTNEELEAANENILDEFVNQTTTFSSWKDMLAQAGEELLIRKLGF